MNKRSNDLKDAWTKKYKQMNKWMNKWMTNKQTGRIYNDTPWYNALIILGTDVLSEISVRTYSYDCLIVFLFSTFFVYMTYRLH